jgi:hypothetical protein
MNHTSPEELFRIAAEGENGASVSAGARQVHIRKAIESGRAFYIDLSGVPENKRLTIVAAIKELVAKASSEASEKEAPAPRSSLRAE